MTRRRWIADTWTAGTASLTGDQAAHLARVLRATPGQVFDVVAGGFLHRGEITSVSGDRIDFLLHEELESDTSLPVHLLLAVFKFDPMEWAIEKATELGVAHITPIAARRTDKHLAQSAAKRVERWRRIAVEASKQSRRSTIPVIDEPTALKPALEHSAAEPNLTRILLSETEQNTTLADALAKSPLDGIALAIGPEGGWAADEMNIFSSHNWQPVTLGPRILRAETAVIASIAITSSVYMQREPGDDLRG